MENKKDLSEAFALIFGIKPIEVPEKSSGVKMKTTKQKVAENFLKEKGWEFKNDFWQKGMDYRGYNLEQALQLYLPKEEKLIFDFTDFENTINELLNSHLENKTAGNPKTREQSIRLHKFPDQALSEELAKKQKEQMEKSALNESGKIKTVRETSDELNHYSQMEDSKCGDKEVEPDYTYKVLFKDDREAVKITEKMFKSLRSDSPISNLAYNQPTSLIWGYDEDTGEQICLDSFSILAIVKIK